MRFDYGYDEEQRLGKPYDLKLLRRVLPYAAVHRVKLLFSVLLVIAITVLELSVPYITKEVIDRYVVPRDRIDSSLDVGDQQRLTLDYSDPAIVAAVSKYPALFQVRNGTADIRLVDLNKLDPESLGHLRRDDLSGLDF
jgi:ATP-binding cassette subfamily B protein